MACKSDQVEIKTGSGCVVTRCVKITIMRKNDETYSYMMFY